MEKDKKDTEGKNKKIRRWTVWGLAVLAIAAVAAFFLSDRFESMLRKGTHYMLEKTGVSVELEMDGTTMTEPLNDLVLRSNKQGLKALTAAGETQWDISYTMNHPYLLVCGDYAAVADRKGTDVTLVDRSGKNTQFKAENRILFHALNEEGTVAVVTEEEDGHSVTLYAFDGTKLLKRKTYKMKDGIPLAVAVSSDGRRMVTSFVTYAGVTVTSTVTAFDLSASGASLTDRILGSKQIEGTLISELHYIGNRCIYIGDNQIGAISTESGCEESWEKQLTHRIRAVAFGEESFALALGQGLAGTAAEAEFDFLVYDHKGTVMVQKNIGNITELEAARNLYICGSGRNYTGIDLKGKTVWFLDAEEDYRKMVLLGDERTAVAQNNASFVYYEVKEFAEVKEK